MLDSKGVKLNDKKKEYILSKIFISAEEITKLYMNSEAVHKIFPDESNLILSEDKDIYWDLKCKDSTFMDRMNEKMRIFEKYSLEDSENEVKEIESILGSSLKNQIGFGYQEIIDVLVNTIYKNCEYGVKKVLKSDLITGMSRKYCIDKLKIERFLNGFIIGKND